RPLRCVVVGDGAIRPQLEALRSRLGLEGQVEFAGKRDDVEDLLAQSKVFVLTSDMEGMAISMLEAMQSGLPAVVSDVGELGQVVQNGRNGYLVPRRDPEGFAEAILALLEDPQRCQSFGQAAADDAYAFCSAPVISERWGRLLTEVLAGESPTPEPVEAHTKVSSA